MTVKKTLEIHWNFFGDDVTGTGTKRRPFNTYTRAVKAIPQDVDPDTTYVVVPAMPAGAGREFSIRRSPNHLPINYQDLVRKPDKDKP